jgi:phage-related minor tail protein
MNTEAINTLKLIREVKTDLQVFLNEESLKKNERKLLEQVLSNLMEIEDTIILETMQAMVDKINASNADLQKLISQMEEASEKIAEFSNTVKKVSEVISILGEITEKAIKAGIAG